MTAPPDNPLLGPWTGPHGGVPPFDRVRVEHFLPALEAAIRSKLDEVERIATDPEPPTFANTLEALEASGILLERVRAVLTVWRTTMNGPELKAIEGDIMARLTRLDDRLKQDRRLFERIATVYENRESAGLTPEEGRLAWHYYTEFVRAGAALGDAAKARLSMLNERLSHLSTRFDQNVLADEADRYVAIEWEAGIAGLPHAQRRAATAAARTRGLEGWLIVNTRSAVEPFLTHAEDRGLRERVWRTFVTRGDERGPHDNRPVVTEMLTLRAERARLLGYASHAHWAVERSMARTPERAAELVVSVWARAVERVNEEINEMRELARADGIEGPLRPWDYRYYAEKVHSRALDVDWNAVKPYLQLDRLREAMFWVAGELFGMHFEPIRVPVYHPDVRAWEVTDAETGGTVGLFYFDPFARKGKKSGAWMNHYRRQRRLGGEVTPIVSNNCNFLRSDENEPVLLSWTDAVTLFHEFGHALHGLSSSVTHPSLAGTAVSPDYVELPSQIMEFWLSTPEVLRRFAVHHETGEPLPEHLIERVRNASLADEAFSTTEQLGSALVDMRLHLTTDGEVDVERLERETVAEHRMPAEVSLRHRPPHFAHLFSGDHYAARYYSYLWADVLATDAREAFLEGSGMFDRAVAARFRDHVLSRGNTLDPEEAYRAFRGRPPTVDALLRERGFLRSA